MEFRPVGTRSIVCLSLIALVLATVPSVTAAPPAQSNKSSFVSRTLHVATRESVASTKNGKVSVQSNSRQVFLAIGLVELIAVASEAAEAAFTAEAAAAATEVAADAAELADVAAIEDDVVEMETVAIERPREISRSIGRMRSMADEYNVELNNNNLRETADSLRAFSRGVRDSRNGMEAGRISMIQEAQRLGGDGGELNSLCGNLVDLFEQRHGPIPPATP